MYVITQSLKEFWNVWKVEDEMYLEIYVLQLTINIFIYY